MRPSSSFEGSFQIKNLGGFIGPTAEADIKLL